MNLYQSLQISPFELKSRVKEGTTKKIKKLLYNGLIFTLSINAFIFCTIYFR